MEAEGCEPRLLTQSISAENAPRFFAVTLDLLESIIRDTPLLCQADPEQFGKTLSVFIQDFQKYMHNLGMIRVCQLDAKAEVTYIYQKLTVSERRRYVSILIVCVWLSIRVALLYC